MHRSTFRYFALFIFATNLAFAQTREQGPWWPHPIWGAGDQVGASNWITPDKVLESLSAVKTGKVYEMGFMYHSDMPLVGGRSYEFNVPETFGPFGDLGMIGHGEKLSTDIGQIGTQFDGLGHIGQRIVGENGEEMDVFYNGFTVEDVYAPEGLKKLGIEHVRPIITRGYLIDIAGYKNVRTLPERYYVSVEDVRGAIEKQGFDEADIKPGDALFFNFGWSHFADDKEKYARLGMFPGLDPEVGQWIIEKKATLIGSDASADPAGQGHIHFELLMKNGIHNLEFMTFESLLEDQVHNFLFVFTPVPFKGATGSPGRPIAIH